MQTIYIVEDDDNIRDLVTYALKASEYTVVGFESGKEFWKRLEKEMPVLVILDIMLPDEDGISIIKELRKNQKTTNLPVIFLTAKTNEYNKILGLDLGADDYISKPFSVLELISRINAVLRRYKPLVSLGKIAYGQVEVDLEKRTVISYGENIVLTYKEFEVLYCLLSKAGTVYTRDKLMEIVWGFDFEGESRTVDMHIKTLRQKLKKGGEIIKTIRGVGYKIGD